MELLQVIPRASRFYFIKMLRMIIFLVGEKIVDVPLHLGNDIQYYHWASECI